jgi:hypothetical protein
MHILQTEVWSNVYSTKDVLRYFTFQVWEKLVVRNIYNSLNWEIEGGMVYDHTEFKKLHKLFFALCMTS